MSKTRTYIDSGVLIDAARGVSPIAEAALAILCDPGRVLVSSEMTRLEVLPKARYHKRRSEVAFYETYFRGLGRSRLVPLARALVQVAMTEAEKLGLAAVDALHVAAAREARCVEFITTERTEKPLFRVGGLIVRSLR